MKQINVIDISRDQFQHLGSITDAKIDDVG